MNKFFIEYKDYYQLDELQTIFNNEKTLIVFDTNIFLDLYSYPLDTRNSIIDSIRKVKGILWSPHHIFLEYHKNRREIIYKSKNILDEIQSTLGSFTSGNSLNISSISTYKSKYGKFHSELTDSIQKVIDKYSPLYEDLQKQLIADVEPIKSQLQNYKKQDTVSLTGDDPVLNFLISKYTDNDIGTPYDEKTLSEICKECDERILKKIPPAFKDGSKSEKFSYRGTEYDSKYGDFIIYKQILDYCNENNISNVFFISNDVKRDWREPVPHENNKYYGARKELRAEAYLEANIENLILLDLKEYFKVLGIELSRNIVEDIDALKRFHNDKKQKIMEQRRKELRDARDEINSLKDQPIKLLFDIIKGKNNRSLYMNVLRHEFPELWSDIQEYRHQNNIWNSKKIPQSVIDSINATVTPQQVPKSVIDSISATVTPQQVPQSVIDSINATVAPQQVPQSVIDSINATVAPQQVPQSVIDSISATVTPQQVPQSVIDSINATVAPQQVPQSVIDSISGTVTPQQVPQSVIDEIRQSQINDWVEIFQKFKNQK